MFPILLLVLYGCSEKGSILTPSAPEHYLVVYAPEITVNRPAPSKPLFKTTQQIDTIVTIKFVASADDDPRIAAWALGPLAYKRVFDYDWEVWESKYISIPCPAKKTTAEFCGECTIDGQRFKMGSVTIPKGDLLGVTIAASWTTGPLKYENVMFK
jgi:hypothetical protein